MTPTPEAVNELLVIGRGAGLDADAMRDLLTGIGRDDPERGHALADQLMRCALQLIADGHPRPAELARTALTVESADFPRWMA